MATTLSPTMQSALDTASADGTLFFGAGHDYSKSTMSALIKRGLITLTGETQLADGTQYECILVDEAVTDEAPVAQAVAETPQAKRVYAKANMRTLAVHHGPNRHQRRTNAKTARTQPYRDAMRDLKITMNRIHRHRYNNAQAMNIGGQFRNGAI